MRTRLTRTMVLLVLGALLLSSAGTLAVVTVQNRRQAEDDLVRQAQAIADQSEQVRAGEVLRGLRQALQLQQIAVISVGPGGRLLGELPPGIESSQIDIPLLRSGQAQSGRSGRLVYAIAAIPGATTQSGMGPGARQRPGARQEPGARQGPGAGPGAGAGQAPPASTAGAIVILTREVESAFRQVFVYVLLAAGVALFVTSAVAAAFSRRITAPLAEVEGAAARIARGERDVRVPLPDAGDEEAVSLAKSVNRMATALEETQERQREFFLSVSHELRTPLTSIRGFAEALADGTIEDSGRAAAVITSEAGRLERLVGDLLELAKLDAHQFPFRPAEIDVVEVVAGVADAFQPKASEIEVALQVSLPDQPAVANLDPDRLAQVVANLVENALKYARSEVGIRGTSTHDSFLLAIRDDGPGIAPDKVQRVFDRFYRSETRPGRQIGSGLGLAIVSELVSAMQGEVSAKSDGHSWSELLVRLPLVR